MSDLLDKSLDQIIASREGSGEGRKRGRGGGGRRGGQRKTEDKKPETDRVITVVKRASQEASSGPSRRAGADQRNRRQAEAAPYSRQEVGRPAS